jgi:hypothetical protein
MSDADRNQNYIFENLPKELHTSHRWLVWKYGSERNKKGKFPKVPCDSETGFEIDKLKAARLSLNKAVELYSNSAHGFSGIGFLACHPYIGVDFDKCVSEAGEIGAEVRAQLDWLRSYSEISPSGTGVRVWVRGEAPKAPQDDKKNPLGSNRLVIPNGFGIAEIYPDAPNTNYLTCTGWHIKGTPREIRELNTQEMTRLYSLASKSEAKAITSGAVALREKTRRLLERDIVVAETDDNSRIVQKALVALLYDTALDCEKSEALFKESKLYRETDWGGGENKWKRLGASEMEKALACARDLIFKGRASKSEPKVDPDKWRDEFRSFDQMVERENSFLIDLVLLAKTIMALGGLTGHGKTLLFLSMIKSLLTQEPWLGLFKVPEAKDVLYITPEADESAIKKRLRLFGLDKFGDRVLIRTLTQGPTLGLTDPRMLRAAEGRVNFFDPAIRFLNGGNENEASDVSSFLADALFNLLSVGAEGIVIGQHSPKKLEEQTYLCTENVLRGSPPLAHWECSRRIHASAISVSF